MVGGGRRDEGSLVINNNNVFAALETLRKKKKSDKERGTSKSAKGSSKSQLPKQQHKEPEPEVFWAPAPLNAKSWADVEDEDDDDYFATTAPPQAVWVSSEPHQSDDKPTNIEESESEEDILDEGDDEVDEEHDHEPEVPVHSEPVAKKLPEVSAVPKETERQLSKKERKKKELAELEALLADFGVSQKDSNGQDQSRDAAQEGKEPEPNAEGEKKESAPGESKSAKKKKKKDKSKEVKEPQDQSNTSEVDNGADEAAGTEQVDEDSSAVDVKERLKRMASAKKKKSSKEMDNAAKAAAQEAAARSARLAAAKKKEKNHYNQQPVR
ncbi:hypothetical protein P3X46_007297 [Hevea brasiliensis]|uniref:Uncharacterized protein n=1 Tax=Hevea brasiliensis TaxID=3981 RepID=A0ABQ9MWX2_HEVBR|nr:uncharacterized protein LOC110657443 [Hevea brasiliensis]KAJ9183445.1 hypothetical protein P3X46_007297 [Hevea brasiliensis]